MHFSHKAESKLTNSDRPGSISAESLHDSTSQHDLQFKVQLTVYSGLNLGKDDSQVLKSVIIPPL